MEWRSRGYLPHYDGDAVQHLVFGLADAAPARAVRNVTNTAPQERHEAFEAMFDVGHGGRILANPRAADIVQRALLYFDAERYCLLGWCVMPTHVHALIEIRASWPMASVMHSWKSFTANAVNQCLGRTGSLWGREYFDRMVRDDDHLEVVRNYIENNPVAAGLVGVQNAWPWSSASLGEPV